MDINFLAVFLAALSAFFLGYLWYTVIFVKPWQKELGMNAKKTGTDAPNLGQLLAGSFALEVVMAVILAMLIGKDGDASKGLVTGLMLGLAVGCAFGVNYLFEGKSLKLWLINASYNVVVFSVMGLVIGVV